MQSFPVVVPSAGESITSAQIANWCKNSGDSVSVDDVLVELETEKATLEVVAEQAGILHILHPEGTVVKVGDVIANIAPSDAKTASPPAQKQPPSSQPPSVEQSKNLPCGCVSNCACSGINSQAVGLSSAQGHPFPAAAAVLQSKNLSPADVSQPSGVGGRISLQDAHAAQKQSPPSAISPASPQTVPSLTQPLSMMRKTIANRLMRAQLTKAILSTFNEVDMHAVMELRKTYKDEFFKKHGVKLGLNGFFLKSAAHALRQFPIIGAKMDDQSIYFPQNIDISVAVATPKGLAVPVLRDVDRYSLAQIESQLSDLAQKGRDGKLTPQDMSGGCFTITNGGVFGSMLSTPIINGEQSAILGLHNIVSRPHVVDGQILPRPIMYLALSYDHRLIDGEQAVKFLVCIKRCIEDPLRIFMDV